METFEKIIIYVIYGLMSMYIVFFCLRENENKCSLPPNVPIFKLLSYVLLYFVCELDIIMGILMLIILFLND